MTVELQKKSESGQLNLFEMTFWEDTPKEENHKKELVLEHTEVNTDFFESEFEKGDPILYRGEKATYLGAYSNNHKSSSIRLGEAYMVVLTSTINKPSQI